MLLPINWLKQYVEINETPEQVAERYIGLGFECELVKPNVIDLEVTPNRGDVLSIIGLAREYAASTGQHLQMPKTTALATDSKLPDFSLEVEPEAYHRLAATLVKGVKNQPSPTWLREAVESVGMNSIDVIVDLTNYVMFEFGIPMHAFDLDALPAQSFHVRLSTKGEHFTSLKEEAVELPEQAIVVESNGEIIDLLGIRGGKSSMIQPQTTNILVWAVSVPRPLIRRAVKMTGIRTEGAYRHERETDWDMVPLALARFVDLLTQVAGGQPTSAIDWQAQERESKLIAYSVEHINRLLGTDYSSDAVERALTQLGFVLTDGKAMVPSWRYFDINFPEDLAEEVARIQGYTALPKQRIQAQSGPKELFYAQVENLKDRLVAAGLTEVYTESFAGRQEAKLGGWDESNLAVLANPVNQEFAYCRPSMIPNLVKLLALNSWSDDARVFEVGKVFPAKDLEVTKIALAAYGKQQKLFTQWVPVEAIEILTPDHPLAQLHKLRRPVTVAEVAIDEVILPRISELIVPTHKVYYQTISPLPPAVRDISIIVDRTAQPDKIAQQIKAVAPETILLVELFDQFTADKFGADKQSLAFHIIYQSLDQTLEAETVDLLQAKINAMLEQQFEAVIR